MYTFNVFNETNSLFVIMLQKDLDVIASDLTSRQDDSEASRRQLVEMSREFKKTLSPVYYVCFIL